MQQDLNIKALKNLFSSRNTTYKFLLFYSVIKLIKEFEDPVKNIEIFYKQIIKEILVIAWLPSFQFNLNFNEQDKIKDYLIEYMKNSPEIIKNNKPTNKIINKISSEIDLVLNDKEILERLENDLINKDVVTRLIRPFYKRAKGIPEAGQNGWYQNCEKYSSFTRSIPFNDIFIGTCIFSNTFNENDANYLAFGYEQSRSLQFVLYFLLF